MKKLFFLFFVLLYSLSYSQQNNMTIKAIGYGKDKESAFSDAITTAVQQAVGIMVETKTHIVDGELVKDKVITKSMGYVQKFNIIEPYDGNKIILEVTVSSDKLKDELILFSKAQQEVYFDGETAVISAKNKEQMRKKVLSDLPEAALDCLYDLTDSLEAYMVSRSHPIIDKYNEKNLSLSLNIEEKLNKEKYSAAVKKFDRLFKEAGATTYTYTEKGKLPPNTVVIGNINHKMTAYQFDNETFEALENLYSGLQVLYNNYFIDILFLDEGKNIIKSEKLNTYNNYFSAINSSKTLESFYIEYVIVGNSKHKIDISMDSKDLSRVKAIIVKPDFNLNEDVIVNNTKKIKLKKAEDDYYAKKKAEKDQIEAEKKLKKNEKKKNYLYNYNSRLTLSAGGGWSVSMDDSMKSNGFKNYSGFAIELKGYFFDIPYIGIGFEAESGSTESKSIYEEKSIFETNNAKLEITEINLKLIGRIPISKLELFGAVGGSYKSVEVTDAGSHSSFGYSWEAGVNFYITDFFGGVKYYQSNSEEVKIEFNSNFNKKDVSLKPSYSVVKAYLGIAF